jgi:hypothetical protein
MTDDGTLTVTTPAGISHTTAPPGLTTPRADILDPAPAPAEDPPPF